MDSNNTPKSGNASDTKSQAPTNLNSVYSDRVPEILKTLKSTLTISTYQAGRLIIARPQETGLNTYFLGLNKPMGIAIKNNRLAVGSKREIIEYHNVPATAPKVEPVDTHDACFIPRTRYITGNVDIHEMAYDKDNQLWFVNTLFSCLCTRSLDNSFEPRWRPKFINGYAPQDRCHLNGLAMENGRPKYVSALDTGNTPQAWRKNKLNGGVIIDIDSDELITQGLCMPHSPRVYRDKLYVLESGKGTLATVDRNTGELTTVCKLPGFTRGLDFVANVAFVGISQIRESNLFGGLPISDEIKEPVSGVWMVDIQSGNILGFIRFSGSVQEIFAVQAIQGAQYPIVLDAEDPLVDTSYVLSNEAIKSVDFASIKVQKVKHREAEEKKRKGALA